MITGSDLVEKWIELAQKQGMTRDEIAGMWFVYGNTVYRLTKSGKTKYNLKIQVGCVNLVGFARELEVLNNALGQEQ